MSKLSFLLSVITAIALSSWQSASAQNSSDEQDFSRNELYQLFIVQQGLEPGGGRAPRKWYVFPKDDDDGKTYGIDVSHHKGPIDWSQVSTSGVKFSYTKATQGTGFVDYQFKQNMAGPRKYNIPTGAYHFLSAKKDIAAQTRHFINTYKKHRREDDLPPVLDLEWDAYKIKGKAYDRFADKTPKQIADMALHWLRKVEQEFGQKPIIYTNKYWWEARLGKQGIRLKDYRIWMSRYGKFNDAAPPMPPHLEWAIWQFTEHGTVPGINGRVDINFTAEDFDLLNNEPEKQTITENTGDDPVDQKLKQRVAQLAHQNKLLCEKLRKDGQTCPELLDVKVAPRPTPPTTPKPPKTENTTTAGLVSKLEQQLEQLATLAKKRPEKVVVKYKYKYVTGKRSRSTRSKVKKKYGLLY